MLGTTLVIILRTAQYLLVLCSVKAENHVTGGKEHCFHKAGEKDGGCAGLLRIILFFMSLISLLSCQPINWQICDHFSKMELLFKLRTTLK